MKNTMQLIIPAAGIGSRLFPITWAVPKELLPINNKPALHYVLEEALAADIDSVICVHSPRKESLISYLTYKKNQSEVSLTGDEEKRLVELDVLNSKIKYIFKIQEKPLGVGDAILQAQNSITADFFCIAYPDDILIGQHAGLSQLMNIHKKYNSSAILVEKVNVEKIHMYGVIGYAEEVEPGVFLLNKIVEKPNKIDAPSLYGIIGRYIIHKDVFAFMNNQQSTKPCNVQAFNDLIKHGHKIMGVCLNGKRCDIGTLAGWLETVKEVNNL
jgi:UTP--glucose-1-phosphate uridylyltransferase